VAGTAVRVPTILVDELLAIETLFPLRLRASGVEENPVPPTVSWVPIG